MSQISTNLWTYKTSSSAQTLNITYQDSLGAISITVSGSGSNSATVTGSLAVDGNASTALTIGSGETITISAPQGKVIDNLTIVTSSDMDTSIVARQ